MANFIKLTRSDGPRQIKFYLNADYLGQFQPDENDGTVITVSKMLNTAALGFSDSIHVKETPDEIENMIASRSYEKNEPFSMSYKYASHRQTDFDGSLTKQYNDGCTINPNNIYAILMNYDAQGAHYIQMTNGHYFEISDRNLGKIITQDSSLLFAKTAQLPTPIVGTKVTPTDKKPEQLVLAL